MIAHELTKFAVTLNSKFSCSATSLPPPVKGKVTLYIWNEMEIVHFILQIKYYKSNTIQITTSFKIQNFVADYTLLDPENKIWTMK